MVALIELGSMRSDMVLQWVRVVVLVAGGHERAANVDLEGQCWRAYFLFPWNQMLHS